MLSALLAMSRWLRWFTSFLHRLTFDSVLWDRINTKKWILTPSTGIFLLTLFCHRRFTLYPDSISASPCFLYTWISPNNREPFSRVITFLCAWYMQLMTFIQVALNHNMIYTQLMTYIIGSPHRL